MNYSGGDLLNGIERGEIKVGSIFKMQEDDVIKVRVVEIEKIKLLVCIEKLNDQEAEYVCDVSRLCNGNTFIEAGYTH